MNGTAQLFTGLFALILILVAFGAVAIARRRREGREAGRRQRDKELAAATGLVYEDVTAFGEDLQQLDSEVSRRPLDVGAHADYERALDAYEAAKSASDLISEPDDVRRVTEILDEGRYAIACVRARASGVPLPTRRPPCFFDPRHGPSVADVRYAPFAGVGREVPACALDAERVRAGADPAVRKVLAGGERVPYWQGGRGYQPYAAGYFGASDALTWLFLGSLAFDGFGDNGLAEGGDSAEYAHDDGRAASDSSGPDAHGDGVFDGGGDFGF